MKALIVLCLLASAAHAQIANDTPTLEPVAPDFCKSCRRLTTTPVPGVGTAVVYADEHPAPQGGTTYWLAVVTKAQTFAAGVFEVYPDNCGAGHCEYIDAVAPSLRTFTYRAGKRRVTDVGLALSIDRTRDLLETEPRTSVQSKQWVFVVCGEDAGTWACRQTQSECGSATWVRGAAPAVTMTCTEPLARGE